MKMRISKLKLLLLMAMSFFGLWASSMVVIVFWALKQTLPFCPTGSYSIFGLLFVHLDCGEVLRSPYSMVFGFPLELLAVVYFITNLALVYLIAFASDRIFRLSLRTLFAWRFLGLLMVPYLLFVELFLLRAICVYCTIMHIAIVLDFIVISYFLFYKKSSFLDMTPAQPISPPP